MLPSSGSHPAAAPASGWRLESSLGIQIRVPAHWAVNDYGCNMSDAPTVVRGKGVEAGCFTPEAPTKELAWIGPDSSLPVEASQSLSRRALMLGAVRAERAEGTGADGRHVGWLKLPALGAAVVVKTLDPAVRSQILDSVAVVEVDHHGCPSRRPAAARPAIVHPQAASRIALEAPRSISICYYGTATDLLQSSTRLEGAHARQLAARLNAMPAGPNPDTNPRECLHPPAPPPADAVLLIDDGAARGSVYVAFSGCIGRGLDNGARRGHVGAALLKAIMDPLGTGYGFSGPLSP